MIKRLNKINVIIFLSILITLFIKNRIHAEETSEIKDNSTIQEAISKNATTTPQANIFLNFEKATLSSVVNYLTEEKKINFVPNKALEAIPVSLTTREPLTLEKAWNILLTLLEINGYTIINVDNIYRIVAKAQNKQEPLPMYSGIEPELLPDTDEVIRYIYFLKNIKADMVQSFLATMLENPPQANTNLDALIITDRSLHIKAAMKIIKELDQGGLRESIKIVNLKHTIADDVVKIFDQIIPKDQQKNMRFFIPGGEKKPATYFSQDTKIISEPRQNSLILLGIEKNLNKIIEFVKTYIDIPGEAAGSRIHIKELKYAKAENVKPLLTNIIKPPAGISKTLQVGEYKFFEDVLIEADVSIESDGKGGGNRLIIACSNEDWLRLEKLIDSIDKPSPQVAFEIMIVDVNIESDAELKAQFLPKHKGMLGKNINPYFETAIAAQSVDLIDAATPPVNNIRTGKSGTNITFGTLPGTLWGSIKAVLNKTNSNVIIEPYITTNNNLECIIDATETRQVDANFSEKSLATSPIREKKEKTASTIVKLTPKINLDGSIDLKVFIDITNFTETDKPTNPNTSTRKMDTRFHVETGEIIVLGGLTKSKHVSDFYKVPILGDIPIIGNLFKSKTQIKTKANLYVFIRPSIIKPKIDGTPDEYTQMKLDYAKHQIYEHDTFTSDKDPIQRWFFKPAKQSVTQKIKDTKAGVFRPIDNYATGYNEPIDVDMQNDTYYRAEKTASKKTIAKNSPENNKIFARLLQPDTAIQTRPAPPQNGIKQQNNKPKPGRLKKSRLKT